MYSADRQQKKKTRQGGGNTRRRFFLQELELKKLTWSCIRSFSWTPCRENDFANQDVRQAHKKRSPEAMTGLTNLIASPNPWQLQKHATNIIRTRPSWADMPSYRNLMSLSWKHARRAIVPFVSIVRPPNRNQLKTSEDFELVYFAFPLRRKNTDTLTGQDRLQCTRGYTEHHSLKVLNS